MAGITKLEAKASFSGNIFSAVTFITGKRLRLGHLKVSTMNDDSLVPQPNRPGYQSSQRLLVILMTTDAVFGSQDGRSFKLMMTLGALFSAQVTYPAISSGCPSH